MKISRIAVHQVDLPMREGPFSWASGTVSAFDSTVVVIETDAGVTGAGEVCPHGPAYLPAYAEGARTGIAKLAPDLIGESPLEPDRLNRRMDALLKGHPYVKSAIDMACWDILGKAAGLPVYILLGGLLQESVGLYKVIGRADPEAMADKLEEYRALGFRRFQMKVGEDPDVDIERIRKVAARLAPGEVLTADANTGWRQHAALRVVDAVRDLDIYLEQPCLTYEECLAVRRHTDRPMILDECMDGVPMLLRGHADGAMDVVNLKISRVGGLTRARQFRDLCITLGIAMTVEDSWGGEIATAAIAHLAHATPRDLHFQSSAFHDYASVEIAAGGPVVDGGVMRASARPGLGVEPRMEALGAPLFEVA